MTKINEFMRICGQMKGLQRSGWVNRQVKYPESDAGHSWGLSLLVQLYAPKELDLLKCLKMANIHDLAETIAGDPTPKDEITPDEKHQSEVAAMCQLAKELNNPELIALFNEFEAQETPEAVFVRNLDKLDAVILAKYYDETQNYGGKLFEEFYDYAEKKITHPVVVELLKGLKSER